MIEEDFFPELWHSYSQIAPSVNTIKSLFENRGEVVVNDHIAFRTIDAREISIAFIQETLFERGYKVFDSYIFKEKKLIANAYIHEDKSLPKIFLSGLQLNYLSLEAQKILADIVYQASYAYYREDWSMTDVLTRGKIWKDISIEDYQTLYRESEYAAWVAAFGIRPNHFTVSINNLKTLNNVESVLSMVESNGFKINESGGRVKGNPSLLLEQGSTMAEMVDVKFSDGTLKIPSCYYEFALRHPDANGNLYQGFIEKSADKIFESTNSK